MTRVCRECVEFKTRYHNDRLNEENKVRDWQDPVIEPARSERVVWIWCLITGFNDHFGAVS